MLDQFGVASWFAFVLQIVFYFSWWLTCLNPNGVCKHYVFDLILISDRMPVILGSKSSIDLWLDNSNQKFESLLVPYEGPDLVSLNGAFSCLQKELQLDIFTLVFVLGLKVKYEFFWYGRLPYKLVHGTQTFIN